jgi:hypothetical protein
MIHLFLTDTFQQGVIALQNPQQFISYGNAACVSDVLGLYLIRDTDNLRQPFPTFYVCDAKVANGM